MTVQTIQIIPLESLRNCLKYHAARLRRSAIITKLVRIEGGLEPVRGVTDLALQGFHEHGLCTTYCNCAVARKV